MPSSLVTKVNRTQISSKLFLVTVEKTKKCQNLLKMFLVLRTKEMGKSLVGNPPCFTG
jgi:hypothetical protein